jgi:hypothetical protein
MGAFELIAFIIDALGKVEGTDKLGKIVYLLMSKFPDLGCTWPKYEWGALGPWSRELSSYVESLRRNRIERCADPSVPKESDRYVVEGTINAGEIAEAFEIRYKESTAIAELAKKLNEQTVQVLRYAAAVVFATTVWHHRLTLAKWIASNALGSEAEQPAMELLRETGILKEATQGGEDE